MLVIVATNLVGLNIIAENESTLSFTCGLIESKSDTKIAVNSFAQSKHLNEDSPVAAHPINNIKNHEVKEFFENARLKRQFVEMSKFAQAYYRGIIIFIF